ncbi:MAG: YihA family ribosome biogenesis GTP-binding protein, partial [Oscillospiraceae bacterium]|nr:YihA family ribosome biogenesis GTP-binding protein [Oscillospiraceae bacterium]
DTEMPFAIVLTKADKLNKTERAARLAALPDELPQFEDLSVTVFSSVTGEGVEPLRALIEEITADDPEEA